VTKKRPEESFAETHVKWGKPVIAVFDYTVHLKLSHKALLEGRSSCAFKKSHSTKANIWHSLLGKKATASKARLDTHRAIHPSVFRKITRDVNLDPTHHVDSTTIEK